MINDSTIRYLLNFLCSSTIENNNILVYCRYEEIKPEYHNVIVRSNFFDDNIYGTHNSIPKLPLLKLLGVPILYGEPVIEKKKSQTIIKADLVASTFFLISRYEEMVREDCRDKYGRFIGRESLLYKCGCIDRPIVDEYREMVDAIVSSDGSNNLTNKFSNIYLTHDIDVPWEYFNLYTAFKRIVGNILRKEKITTIPISNALGFPEKDHRYKFNKLINMDAEISNATSIYFIKGGGKSKPQDYIPYIKARAFKKLLEKIKESGASIGYHVSYEASENSDLIPNEIYAVEKASGRKINSTRYHYLHTSSPKDFDELIKNGVTDDFTMGYADISGFRLGTSRAVRWISPYSKKVSKLTMHPLMIMDCSLTDKGYMNLDENSAVSYAKKLILQVKTYGGEIVLLWHNNIENINWNIYHEVLKIIANEVKQ